MKRCYIEEFSKLFEMVEQSREKLISVIPEQESAFGDLILFSDLQFRTNREIVDANEYRVTKRIESIAVALFSELNDIKYSLYPISSEFKNMSFTEQEKTRPFKIILHEKQNRIGLIFCNRNEHSCHLCRFSNGEYDVDALKIIVLSNPHEDARKISFDYENKRYRAQGLQVERIPILEFWENYFGIDERNNLVECITLFNEKARKAIGFNTIVTPTEKAIERFKEKCAQKLKDIPISYTNNQANEIINKNYLERGLWKAMIGDKDFAISFITSEWHCTMYELTECLDLTNIVAGYLKSIEQLVYAIIQLHKDTNVTIKTKEGIKILTSDTKEIADITLGSLENVLQYNEQIFAVDKDGKRQLQEIIKNWREEYRNKFFHKDNIKSKEKVEEIRKTAYQLYYLILGSFDIADDYFANLGIV